MNEHHIVMSVSVLTLGILYANWQNFYDILYEQDDEKVEETIIVAEAILPTEPFLPSNSLNHHIIRNMWRDAECHHFQVRGRSYFLDKHKIQACKSCFQLIYVQVVNCASAFVTSTNNGKIMISEIAQYTGAKTQILILNIQLPSGPNIVMYWHASIEKINANKLWKTFTNESDAYRQQRLKLLPNIHQGPWILQRAIGNAPVMLAQKVHVSYHKPLPHVFEIHANINSSLATKIVSLCKGYSTSLAINLGIVLQANTKEELPEQLLASVCLDKLDLSTIA